MEAAYLDLLRDVLENGEDAIDRTGTGTRSLFGRQMRFDLSEAFPAITTKTLAWRAVKGELLWFLEGSGSNERLAEITTGNRDARTIWTDNAEAPYWKPKAAYAGDLGRVYGVQWRKWQSTEHLTAPNEAEMHDDGSVSMWGANLLVKEIDQIARIVESLRTNPKDRRMILTAFNVGELDQMALPPCHMFAQFHVNMKTNKLNSQVYIRSNDLGLGAPFNIASYALLTMMIAQVCNLEYGDFVHTFGDAHLYKDHFEQAKLQLTRTTLPLPQMKINPQVNDIESFVYEDFELIGYQSHPHIKAKVSV